MNSLFLKTLTYLANFCLETILDIYLRSETCDDEVVKRQAEQIKCCCNVTKMPKIDRYCGTSLIVINGVDYSLRQRGLNVAVAVYNNKLSKSYLFKIRGNDAFIEEFCIEFRML